MLPFLVWYNRLKQLFVFEQVAGMFQVVSTPSSEYVDDHREGEARVIQSCGEGGGGMRTDRGERRVV